MSLMSIKKKKHFIVGVYSIHFNEQMISRCSTPLFEITSHTIWIQKFLTRTEAPSLELDSSMASKTATSRAPSTYK